MAQQASSLWRTWNAGFEGGYQDAYIFQNFWTGNRMLQVRDENNFGPGYHDVVRKFGHNTTGAFDLSFDLYVPTGYRGYFNLQSSQSSLVGGGYWQIFFEGNGIARIIINGVTYHSFFYTTGSWTDISMRINLDTDVVTFKANGGNTKTLHYNGNIGLGGINFYAVEGALFYVDNILLEDAYCNGFTGEETDASKNADTTIDVKELERNPVEKPAIKFDQTKVNVPQVDKTVPSPKEAK